MDRISQSSAGGLMSSMGKEVVCTPYFVVDERRLLHNLEILKQVAEESGCKILLAQKAFSMFSVYPLLRKYLCGTTASGLYEARLGKEEFGGETHVFSPAYRAEEFDELLQYVSDLYLTLRHRFGLGFAQRMRENLSDCVSIRSVPHRRAMPFTTHAHRVHGLEQH